MLKNNTFMAIKTCMPTCTFEHVRHLRFEKIHCKDKFSTLAHTAFLLCILLPFRKNSTALENTRKQTKVQ